MAHDESHGQSASDCTICEARAIEAAMKERPVVGNPTIQRVVDWFWRGSEETVLNDARDDLSPRKCRYVAHDIARAFGNDETIQKGLDELVEHLADYASMGPSRSDLRTRARRLLAELQEKARG